jgi:hypothetical protein
MTPEEFNKKYEQNHEEMRNDFFLAIKTWLQDHPDQFIVFRTYIPGFNDGEPCLPCIDVVGAAPGFVEDYYADSDGGIQYVEDVNPEDLPEADRTIFKAGDTDLAWEERQKNRDSALEQMLVEGFRDFIDEWNVTGTIKLVNDRRRKDHGEPEVTTEWYDCGY